jgi:predicted transcriptional regulator
MPKARKAPAKATTVRLEPRLLRGLELLRGFTKKPLNRLVNEAVLGFIERRSAQVESDLQDQLARVRAYRRSDPGFERAIGELVDAETRHGARDPIEGRSRKATGPAQAKVRELLGG